MIGELIGFLMMDGIYPSSSERKMVVFLLGCGIECMILALVVQAVVKIFAMD